MAEEDRPVELDLWGSYVWGTHLPDRSVGEKLLDIWRRIVEKIQEWMEGRGDGV